jgi:hypothetical protein
VGTTEEGRLPERFAEMLRDQPEPAGGNVPLAALRQRFSRSSDASGRGETELQALLHRAGVAQVDAALARRAPVRRSGERMVRPRLLGLDTIRLLVVVFLGLATFLTLWTLDLTLRASANDELSARADRIDLARWAVLVAFGAANTCTVLWVGVAARHLGRAGIADIGRLRWWFAAAGGAAATALSGAFGRDLAEPANLVLLAVPVGVATWASVAAVSAARAMQLRAIPHLVWTAAVPLVAVVLALGRFGREVTGDVSVGRIVFVGAFVGVMWCVLIVLVALATSEFQDELKRAPALAVPAGRQR